MGLCACVRRFAGLLPLVLAFALAATGKADLFVVSTTADSGPGTLRAAIELANSVAGPHTIEFAIPTTDPGYVPGATDFWRITLGAGGALPVVTSQTTIDGWSQRQPPGPGLPIIEVDGDALVAGDGLVLGASTCIVRGLALVRFPGSGLAIQGATIQRCWVYACNFGVDPFGLTARGNGQDGVQLRADTFFNRVGTNGDGVEDSAERCILSGNSGAGVRADGSGRVNIIAGNFIGTDSTGLAALGNAGGGVVISSAERTFVGSNTSLDPFNDSERNLISGNIGTGVLIEGTRMTGSVVAANFIGTDITGAAALPNTGDGVVVTASPTVGEHRIGAALGIGADPSQSNTIAFNGLCGVLVTGGVNTSILSNSIYDNGELGIDLAPGGVRGITLNDTPLDIDTGPNNLQNFPIVLSVSPGGVVAFVLNSEAMKPYRVELFINRLPDPSELGEGQVFLGGVNVTTNIAGTTGLMSFVFNPADYPDLIWVTATATEMPPNQTRGVMTDATVAIGGPTSLPSSTSEFSIAVPFNFPPTALPQTVTTPESTDVTITLEGIDPEMQPLTASISSLPARGMLLQFGSLDPITSVPTLVTDALNRVVFQPAPGESGSPYTTFAFRVNDGMTTSAPATVTVNVLSLNDPPVAFNDAYSTNEDTALNVPAITGILANDADPDLDTLTAVLVSGPLSAQSFTLNADGSFTYTPVPNFAGADGFTYQARDPAGLLSNIASVVITVNPVNDAPIATDDAYSTNEDTALSIPLPGVLVNDTDIDGGPLTAVLVAGPSNAQSFALNANGSFTFTPALNFVGMTTFTYRAFDGAAQSNTATVTINVLPINDPPVAVDDIFNINEDTTLTPGAPGVLANDTDVDGGPLSAQLVTGPANAQSFVLNANGSFTYTPALNFNGVDSFTYRAFDGLALSNIATVTINIAPINDAPVALNDAYTTPEDTTLTVPAIGVLINDSDADGDALAAELVSGPASAAAFALSADGSFTYTPALNFNGNDTFTYRAFDGQSRSNTATVTITIGAVNDVPVAVDDAYTTNEDTALTVPAIGVLVNDTDADSQPLVAELVSPPANASAFALAADGSFTYTPTPDFNGATSFTYRAFDGTARSNIATVTITVVPVNDPPVARCRDVVIDARTECPSLFITVDQVDNGSSDLEDGLAITRVLSNLGPFALGPAQVTLTVTDSGGLSDSCTATVTVLGEDCQPNGIPDSCEVAGGEVDCDMDVIPDTCECFWDNGEPPLDGTAANGLLSHLGGGAPLGAKAAEDFYLLPGEVHRINGFTGYLLTDSHAQIRHAKIEFYNDCDGRPDGEPFATFDESSVVTVTPSSNGFDLVTFFFDLCEEGLWLEGGRSYWVAFYGVTDNQMTDLSFWAIDEASGPSALAGVPPVKADGVATGTWGEFDFGPWEPAQECCIGCVNLAFKLRGESCKVLWDNGRPDLGAGKGGSPSGANRSRVSRTADNFVTPTCDDELVCLIQAWVWTNCSPVNGFIEIYENDCKLPFNPPVFSAAPTRVIPTGATALIEGAVYQGYCLELEMPGWTLLAGRNYWLSAGAHSTGNFSTRAFFANAARPCDECPAPRITPGARRDTSPTPTPWAFTTRDYAFRVAVRKTETLLPALDPGTPPGPNCVADADDSGVVEVTDIFAFLAAWFAGCP